MKKNPIKVKLLALPLAATVAAGVLLAGCANKPVDDVGGNEKEPSLAYGNATLTVDASDLYEGGTHIVNIGKGTGAYLVKNGVSAYTIVTPDSPDDNENSAVGELQTYFELATGVALATIPESEAVWSPTAKFISVGKTSVAESAGVTADEETLGQTGVRIVTEGESLFLLGAGSYGTLYAVYEWLGYAFDWEVYSNDLTVYNTDVRDLELLDYDVTEVPDFEFSMRSHGFIINDEDLLRRFRMSSINDFAFGNTRSNIWHNALDWLPYATYGASHPLWYNEGTTTITNLCFYAHGDEGEYQAMVAAVTEAVKVQIQANPGLKYIGFSQEDTQTLCSCEVCTEKAALYNGSQAAGVLLFLNDVYAELEDWFQEDGAEYYCGQKFLILAYHATHTPPVRLNAETGEYEALPIDPNDPSKGTFSCENVIPCVAETNADYTYSLLENETVNGTYAENMKGWKAITEESMFWFYGTNFNEYLTPYNSFEGLQETMQFAASLNYDMIYYQHQGGNANSTGFEHLKAYLYYKLSWNVNYNVNELIERFFENYFGAGAEAMSTLFNEYRVQAHVQRDLGYNGSRSIFHSALNEKYWNRSQLLVWADYIQTALDAIAPLEESDPALYQTYYENIVLERVWVYYILISLYSASMSDSELLAYKEQCKADATLTNITLYRESSGAIASLWSSWGIA